MTCADCGREGCDGSCRSKATLPRPRSNKETAAEQARRNQLERGDTLPDIEDEDAESEDDLVDSDGDDSDQGPGSA